MTFTLTCISKFDAELVKIDVVRRTILIRSFLSTPRQVARKRNVQYSQISNSSDSYCFFWLSARSNVSLAYTFLILGIIRLILSLKIEFRCSRF